MEVQYENAISTGFSPVMIVILGGGLSGTLLAYRLSQLQPRPQFLLIEEQDRLGGNHTWSFHESDISSSSMSWVRPLIRTSWDSHEVQFSDYRRTFSQRYHSVTSSQLDEVVRPLIRKNLILKTKVLGQDAETIYLTDQTVVADIIFDARGPAEDILNDCGYQKFVGMDLELQKPHGLVRPVIMDVNCDQKDGYRFFYLLPWTSHSLLIEDTRYSSDPKIDLEAFKSEIREYCKKSNWIVQKEGRIETGSLPIPFVPFSAESKYESSIPIGTRGGYFHWTTGYSFSYAVRIAEVIANEIENRPTTSKTDIQVALKPIQKELRGQSKYLSLLNKMLFLAAEPAQRWKIFHRFYRLKEDLIFRFFEGKLKRSDQARILLGRPPVPIVGALKAILSSPLKSNLPLQEKVSNE